MLILVSGAGLGLRNQVYLHCYALDCASHHLFHPFGTKSIEEDEGMTLMKELTYHSSLKGTRPSTIHLSKSKYVQKISLNTTGPPSHPSSENSLVLAHHPSQMSTSSPQAKSHQQAKTLLPTNFKTARLSHKSRLRQNAWTTWPPGLTRPATLYVF